MADLKLADLRLDPEAVYHDLTVHALRCPTCWPRRNTLWEVNRLCATGRALVLMYSQAEVEKQRLEVAS